MNSKMQVDEKTQSQGILKNALNLIQVGFEDYFNGKEERINSSIRNIYSGILLVLKAKLQELSPQDTNDILIKSKIKWSIENGKVLVSGDGANTIGKDEIYKRFKRAKCPHK